ncbi:MAG: protein TolR [Gammaproteobacteria bacterium]|nr:protein TolR [Gammaproteobacteria bacterium]
MERRRKIRLMGEINVVPYIDVMLVLLIIFMVTAPLLTQGIKVELPKAGAEPLDPTEGQDPLILSVDVDGNMYLNVGDDEESALQPARILQLTAVVLKRAPATPVLVKADSRVAYGAVVAAMVLLQQAGAEKVGFLTDPADFELINPG